MTAELETLQQEIVERRQRMVALLRAQGAPVSVDTTFTEGDRTDVRFDELFGTSDDLIVIHNMGRSCPYCTLWADGFNGLLPQIERRAAVVLMNGDDVATQQEIARDRGWRYRMVSDPTGAFTTAMGFASTDADGRLWRMPGYSTFHRNTDGTVHRVGYDFFGPGDMYMGLFPMMDLLQDGPAGWKPLPTTAPTT